MRISGLEVRAEVRREVTRKFAAGLARAFASEAALGEAAKLPGFAQAFEAWTAAIWAWCERRVSRETEAAWRRKLVADRARWVNAAGNGPATDRDIEASLQSYIKRRCFWIAGLHAGKHCDPGFFKDFAPYIEQAARLDDNEVFMELARLGRRRPSRAKGGRQLQHWLLFCWVPCGLWACTRTEIVERVAKWEFNGVPAKYSVASIRNALRALEREGLKLR